MKHDSRFRLMVLSLAVVGFSGQASAQGTSFVHGQPIALFGGNSLDGWTKRNGQPTEGWIVENGTLFRARQAGDLYHEGTFRDFELHFQWKISQGGNSGLKYRVRDYGNQSLGCEYQILDDQNEPPKQRAGALYAVYEPSPNRPALVAGQWNWSKVVVCGNRLEHWLNGHLVVQASVGSADWIDRVQGSKFRNNEGFGENREGRIFLQDHGHPVWFRQIVLVPLRCSASGAETFSLAGGPSACTPICRCGACVECCPSRRFSRIRRLLPRRR